MQRKAVWEGGKLSLTALTEATRKMSEVHAVLSQSLNLNAIYAFRNASSNGWY